MLHEFVVYMRRIIWEGELWTYRKLNTKTLKWPEPVVKEKVASEKTNGEKDKIKETNSNLRTVKSIISVTCSLSLTRWCQDFSAGQFNASYFKFPRLMQEWKENPMQTSRVARSTRKHTQRANGVGITSMTTQHSFKQDL